MKVLEEFNIRLQIIPHADQRYNTAGDYDFDKNGALVIKLSDLGQFEKTLAIAMHEVTEMLLCMKAGITIKEIDAFDFEFEAQQDVNNMKEPGEDPHAPYYKQHQVASAVERAIIASSGLVWDEHDRAIMKMMADRARSENS